VPFLGWHLRRLAAEASDLLLVYYAGHGLIGSDSHELYLALQGSRQDDPFYTALPFDGIRRAMRNSPARTRVLILDCCFSGRAIDDVMADSSSVLLGQLEVAGTFLLTATPANILAMAPIGARNTAFTGALLAPFRDGIPDGPELLTLDDLYRATLRIAQVTGLPKPQRRETATANQLVLARNPYPGIRGQAPASRVVAPYWEGQTLPSRSRKRPKGGPQRNIGVEHVTFNQHRMLYVIAAVLLALLAALLILLTVMETSTLARLLWGGLALLALSVGYLVARVARFPVSLDIGARGIELFSSTWMDMATLERSRTCRSGSISRRVTHRRLVQRS
jgi:caspase domain-containing protein